MLLEHHRILDCPARSRDPDGAACFLRETGEEGGLDEPVATERAGEAVSALAERPALQLGLSLGVYESEAQANVELIRLGARGIRTARVVQERVADQTTVLRLPAVSEAMLPLVEKLTPELGSKSLAACPQNAP